MALPGPLQFPNPVNEVAARLVAGGVVVMAVAYVATGWAPLLVALLAGFVLRVLFGPRVSPLALLVTRVIVPRLPVEPRLVAGPPKRFAQGIGVVFTLTATVLAFAFDASGAARALLALLAVAALLESVFAVCLGCKAFALLQRVGVIPASVCQECNNLGARLAATAGAR